MAANTQPKKEKKSEQKNVEVRPERELMQNDSHGVVSRMSGIQS